MTSIKSICSIWKRRLIRRWSLRLLSMIWVARGVRVAIISCRQGDMIILWKLTTFLMIQGRVSPLRISWVQTFYSPFGSIDFNLIFILSYVKCTCLDYIYSVYSAFVYYIMCSKLLEYIIIDRRLNVEDIKKSIFVAYI